MEELTRAIAERQPGARAFVDLDDGFVHHEVTGQGLPVGLVHGLTTPMFVWDAMVEALAPRFRVARFDLYGRGLSARPAGRYDLDRFVAQLDRLLRHAHGEVPVRLVAYSWGCGVAAAFAVRHPERVERLVLIAPGGLGSAYGPTFAALRTPCLGELLVAFGGREALLADVRRCFVQPERFEGFVARFEQQLDFAGYDRALLATLRHGPANFHDLYQAVGASGLSLDLLWGSLDAKVPIRWAETFATLAPHARLHRVSGAGHGLLVEHAAEVGERLGRILRPSRTT